MDVKPTNRTALSAGLLINSLLASDDKVKAAVTRVFPVIAEEKATVPYICYKRDNLNRTSVKTVRGANATTYVVEVFAKNYKESVCIAELVAEALDGVEATYTDDDGTCLVARSITLTDGAEGWSGDAYYQQLFFEIRVN